MALQGAGGEQVPVPPGITPFEPNEIAALRQQILESRQAQVQTTAQIERQIKDIVAKALQADSQCEGQVKEMVSESFEQIETKLNHPPGS